MSDPIQIRMGGYGPATTGFSLALKRIGDRLTAEFGDRIDIQYVWNLMDLGYRVNLSAAEPYSLPNLLAIAERGLLVSAPPHAHALPILAPKVLPPESLNV